MSSSSQPNFDRVAHLYRWAEYFTLGPLLQRTRTDLLRQIPARTQALVLGDGDGRFLSELLRRQPGLRVLAVDTSVSMLQLLSRRCLRSTPNAHLQLQHASAHTIVPPLNTDLIVTHFFLDCLTQPELDQLSTQLATAVRPGTLWLLSDFALPSKRILRPLAALYIRSLYLAFRILTGLRVTHLPNPQCSLNAAGFHCLVRRERLFGLLYTELWQYQ